MSVFSGVFKHQGRTDRPLVAVFLLINLVVLINVLLHDPTVGYDSVDHLINIRAIAEGRLPSRTESREFFSPPLPYLVPAVMLSSGNVTIEASMKAGQAINVLLSIGLTFFVLLLCQCINPSEKYLKVYALALTGILPVYYKSFAMVRGEPYLAFFVVFSLFFTIRSFSEESRPGDAVILGLGLGLAVLSRQWGFFVFVAIGFLVLLRVFRDPKKLVPYLRQLAVAIAVAFIISGWFYLHLISNYGTAIAFNRQAADKFSFNNQPRSFYFGNGSGNLFSDPVRASFPNQLFPIFYSEMWGDYWAHFTIFGKDPETGNWIYGQNLESTLQNDRISKIITNREDFKGYLGRVNLVSLLPTFLILIGFFFVLASTLSRLQKPAIDHSDEVNLLFLLLVVISFAGYGWFLIRFPNLNKGDTIKASYALHIFPVIAILAAQPLTSLTQRWPRLFPATLFASGLLFLHNLPAMITRFIP